MRLIFNGDFDQTHTVTEHILLFKHSSSYSGWHWNENVIIAL